MVRRRSSTPAYLNARVPVELYDAVEAYADTHEVGLSEAIRQLLVAGLGGMQLTITDGHGTRVDDSWKAPLVDEAS